MCLEYYLTYRLVVFEVLSAEALVLARVQATYRNIVV